MTFDVLRRLADYGRWTRSGVLKRYVYSNSEWNCWAVYAYQQRKLVRLTWLFYGWHLPRSKARIQSNLVVSRLLGELWLR